MLRTALISFLCGIILLVTAGCQTGLVSPGGDGGSSDFTAQYVSADVSGRAASAGRTGAGSLLDSAAPTAFNSTETANQVTREIEEADIVKLIGHNLFILNSFRGLRIVDVTDWSTPALKGSFGFIGTPVEMYVTNGVAAIIVRNNFTCRLDAQAQPVKQAASTIYMVDVSNPESPTAIDTFDIDGYVGESRRVGDVIYLAGTLTLPATASDATVAQEPSAPNQTSVSPVLPQGGTGSYAPSQSSVTGFVTSVLVADPQNVQLVDQKQFVGQGEIIHATTDAIYIAGFDWQSGATSIRYVDISDPAGAIALRGSVEVAGYVLNRFAMDASAGVLRVVVQKDAWSSRWIAPQPMMEGTKSIVNSAGTKLFTFSVANPDNITPLGGLQIIADETVKAVRFDGLKAYVVTFRRTDPLWVINLTDPAAPAISGYLQAPGYSTYLQSDGNRLVAVGVNDANGMQAQVSLFDVADPAHPSELDRAVLSPGNYSTSAANFDEKAFKLIPGAKLILVPFDTWASGGYKNELAMLDYSADTLAELSTIEHRGTALRSDVDLTANVLWVLSNKALQTLNIVDRTAPVKLAELPIADNIVAWKVIGQYGLRLVAANDSYDNPAVELQVLAAGDPNANQVLARQTFNLFNPRLILTGPGVAVLTGVDRDDNVTLVTIDTNALPALTLFAQKSLDIFPDAGWGGAYLMRTMGTAAIRQPAGMPGMVVMPAMPCWGNHQDNPLVLANGGLAYITMSVTGNWQDWLMQKQVKLVSLADPANPVIAGSVDVNSGNFDVTLRIGAAGNTVFATLERIAPMGTGVSSRPAEAAYYLRRIDCTDLANPAALDAVNVPGIAVGLQGNYVFTVDPQWVNNAIGTRFCSSSIGDNGTATLAGSVDLPAGAPGKILFAGNAAVLAVQKSFGYFSYGYGDAGGGIAYAGANMGTVVASPAMPRMAAKADDCSLGSFNLVSINITDPANPVLATSAQYPGDGQLAGIVDSYVVSQASYGQSLIWKLAGDQTLSFNQVVDLPFSITDLTAFNGAIDLACGPGGVVVVTPKP